MIVYGLVGALAGFTCAVIGAAAIIVPQVLIVRYMEGWSEVRHFWRDLHINLILIVVLPIGAIMGAVAGVIIPW